MASIVEKHDGIYKQGALYLTYKELTKILGKPNYDVVKDIHYWHVNSHDFRRGVIWNSNLHEGPIQICDCWDIWGNITLFEEYFKKENVNFIIRPEFIKEQIFVDRVMQTFIYVRKDSRNDEVIYQKEYNAKTNKYNNSFADAFTNYITMYPNAKIIDLNY